MIAPEIGADRDKDGLGIIAGHKEFILVKRRWLDFLACDPPVPAVAPVK